MTMTNLQKMEMGFDESEKSLVNEKIWFEDRDGHFKFCEEHILNINLRIRFWFLKIIRENVSHPCKHLINIIS